MSLQTTMKKLRKMMSKCLMRRRNNPLQRKKEKISWKIWNSITVTLILLSDYEHRPELDRYEHEGLDDRDDLQELSYGQRREVEAQLNREDRMR